LGNSRLAFPPGSGNSGRSVGQGEERETGKGDEPKVTGDNEPDIGESEKPGASEPMDPEAGEGAGPEAADPDDPLGRLGVSRLDSPHLFAERPISHFQNAPTHSA
jgi:hypothetical protein